jgi:terminase small subunit / prophage DNA-packing protein
MATQADVADHLFMSRQNASDLFARGILPDRGRGGADLDECRRAYIEHIRAQAAGRLGTGDGELDLTEERARKAKEEADRLEMQNAQMRGELLARTDVDAAVVGAFARVRARMIGVPSKVAPIVVTMDSPAEAEAAIRKAVYEALKELADTTVAQMGRDHGDVVEDTAAATGFDG